MGLVTMNEVLKIAHREGYAVPAFNVCNLEYIQIVVETAAKTNSPVIIAAHPVEIEYAGLQELSYLVRTYAERVNIPVVLHLDHGDNIERVIKCIKAGFTSVMYDGSNLDFEDNILKTLRVAEVAHNVGISVEGELGLVGKAELGEYAHSKKLNDQKLTDPHMAAEFVKRTNIDSLAVAIGNAHGSYRGIPNIDIERLIAIHKQANLPLVLHGGSGTPDEVVIKCIKNGISKINISTDLNLAFYDGIINFIRQNNGKFGSMELFTAAKKKASTFILNKFLLFGSLGKAALNK
ncbi:tagatose-bisphosphate aldolase [Candidatus Atribacteria bacterium HGW-Atribacteria-1]|nr:MAG: tagatose-bisphosphate aldolase [Candidatus Atribacteria bacterium HGW-Atribacteria-1]